MWFEFFKRKPSFKKYNWTHIIIHHSATEDKKILPDIQAIRRYHIQHNGWDSIGYHGIVEMINGGWEVLMGRPLNMNGSHTKGMNQKSLGVCLVGNFDVNEPSPGGLKSLAIVVKSWMDMFDIPIENVRGHRDYSPKTCPGRRFDMSKFKKEYLMKV